MVGTVEQNKEAYSGWETWLNTSAHGKESLAGWNECDDGCDNECDQCVWNLVGLEDELVDEFLGRVKVFVEGLVEEFYLHPNWSTEEYCEYGYEMGFLVELYFEYNLEQ